MCSDVGSLDAGRFCVLFRKTLNEISQHPPRWTDDVQAFSKEAQYMFSDNGKQQTSQTWSVWNRCSDNWQQHRRSRGTALAVIRVSRPLWGVTVTNNNGIQRSLQIVITHFDHIKKMKCHLMFLFLSSSRYLRWIHTGTHQGLVLLTYVILKTTNQISSCSLLK